MANVWREPIFDRTTNDVEYAIRKIAEWKRNHTHWADVSVDFEKLSIDGVEVSTTDDSIIIRNDGTVYVEDGALVAELGVVYDLKGCLNLSDITRIEDNINYLASRLTSYRYPVVVYSKEWGKDDIPNALDMKRIADNIRAIFSGYYTPNEAGDVPNIMLSYEDINALERNLYLLRQLLDVMEAGFLPCGTSNCGVTSRLPIRR